MTYLKVVVLLFPGWKNIYRQFLALSSMVTILPNSDVQALLEELDYLQETLPEQARVLRSLFDQIVRHEKMTSLKKKTMSAQQYLRAKERLSNLIQQLQATAAKLGKHQESVAFLEARSRYG